MTFEPHKHLYKVNTEEAKLCSLFSKPFPLFTKECIEQISVILERPSVREKCLFKSEIAPFVYRGLCKHSEFIKDIWSSRYIEEVASNIMETGLKFHPMLYERGHCNVSKSAIKNGKAFDWHYDSQPYVLIVLLSEPSGGVDNCTFYKDASSDSIYALPFPGAGYARILKGSEVEHCVHANYDNRMTMITSFVSTSNSLTDFTNLKFAKTYSPSLSLYAEFILYRLDNMESILSEYDSLPPLLIQKCFHEINHMKNELLDIV